MNSITLLILILAANTPATQPASAPDPDLDWLKNNARTVTGPSKEQPPASQPSPFLQRDDPDTRLGTLTLSNGEKIRGKLSHTAEKPVRIWVEAEKEYHDIPFKLIAGFEAKITTEYDEKEWHFKESGSDIKEFTGKTYPCRETLYTLSLVNGKTITGGIVEPIYLHGRDELFTFSLLKRDKGQVGQKLKDLIFVQRVDFDDAAPQTSK